VTLQEENFYVAGFRAALRREGIADNTRRKYAEHVLRFVEAHEDPLAVTRAEAEGYVDSLMETLSPSSVRLHIAALRRFYDYLDDRELLPGRNPVARIKAPRLARRPVQWLRRAEDDAVYRACMTNQERIVHALLRFAGLRVGEACALLQDDVDLERSELRVKQSKTAAGLRTVPVIPELRVELEAWLAGLAERGQRRGALPLLVTARGTHMKTAFAWRLMKRVGQRADVKVSPHTLRRTFGSDLLNRGVRMETVSKLLGHADVRVTQACYAELLDETIRAEVAQALRG
jgi:integrase/recombinase XerD